MSTKTMKLMLVMLGATAALAAGAGEVRAGTVVSPFGADPTRVIIGARNGQQIVLWRNLFTQACHTDVIGGGSLTEGWTVFTGPSTDNVLVPEGNWATGSCGVMSGTPLNYAGWFVDVALGSGNDSVDTAQGDTWVFGEGGDDVLVSANPFGIIAGGEGNDKLRAKGPGFDQQLFGENGDDCMQDDNGSAPIFHCGPGNDRFVLPAFEAADCEVIVSAC